MNLLARFWRWPLDEKKLFFSACCYACYCYFIVYLQPSHRLKNHLGNGSSAATKKELDANSETIAKRMRLTIQRVMRCLPSKNKCLVYALVCKKILTQQEVPNTLFLGMRKLEGKLLAHAWLTCGDLDIVGCEEKEAYSVIGAFSV